MKINKYISLAALSLIMFVGCEKGLDPINKVEPGADETAPTITLLAPKPDSDKPVASGDEVAVFIFKCIVEDDVELKSVQLLLDGVEIGNYTTFKDYKRLVVNHTYNGLVDGSHVFEVVATDLSEKATTASKNFKKVTIPPYEPLPNEVLCMRFDDNLLDAISGNEIGKQGNPGFAEGKIGSAYAGATEAYITHPLAGVSGDEFSVAFWYKINAVPDRAGIFVINPPAVTADDGNRFHGLRIFRENNGGNQNIGVNLGIGTSDIWVNPFITVPSDEDWMHIALSISTSKATIYINGSIVKEQDLTAGLDWTGCTSITIGSGAPNFIYWSHFSDLSLFDELHIVKRAITQDEVNKLYTGK